MSKLNVVQFVPYYPPHKGGLETHAMEWAYFWSRKWYWRVFNVTTDIGPLETNKEKIFYENEEIGYIKDWVENLVVPGYEIISNFPVYKIWSKKYKLIRKYLSNQKIDFVITRTRFFLTSILGWRFAKKNKIPWIHIEHWSDYVKLNSKIKTLIARFYDKTFGKAVFLQADKIIWVSSAVKRFLRNSFNVETDKIIYRGLKTSWNADLEKNNLKQQFPGKIIVGFVGRLYKRKNVESLIKAYYQLKDEREKIKDEIQIVVVGDWEDYDRLKNLDTENLIYFIWGKALEETLEFQNQFDIHFHTSRPGGGLATTLLQAMYLGNLIVATPYEWANELINNWENGILLQDDTLEELKKWLVEWLDNLDKKEQYAQENQKIIKERFDWDKNIKKYYKLFNK